jgi:hypothetical protein
MDAQSWEHPSPNEGTDNSDKQIANETKTGPSYELASQPACDYADDYCDQKTFARHVHRKNSVSVVWWWSVPSLLGIADNYAVDQEFPQQNTVHEPWLEL